VCAEVLNKEFTFQTATSAAMRHLVWQEQIPQKVLNVFRVWEEKRVVDMPSSWVCAVCQSRKADNWAAGTDYVIRLPCSHAYHASCFVQVRPTDNFTLACPMCRKEYPVATL
jgi:hypothetical protein